MSKILLKAIDLTPKDMLLLAAVLQENAKDMAEAMEMEEAMTEDSSKSLTDCLKPISSTKSPSMHPEYKDYQSDIKALGAQYGFIGSAFHIETVEDYLLAQIG